MICGPSKCFSLDGYSRPSKRCRHMTNVHHLSAFSSQDFLKYKSLFDAECSKHQHLSSHDYIRYDGLQISRLNTIAEYIVRQAGYPKSAIKDLLQPFFQAIVQEFHIDDYTMMGPMQFLLANQHHETKETLNKKKAIESMNVKNSIDNINSLLHSSSTSNRNATNSRYLEKILLNELYNCTYYSLQIEETSSMNSYAYFIVYVQYDHETEENQKILKNELLLIEKMDSSWETEDLFRCLNTFILEKNIGWRKCIHICLDLFSPFLNKHSSFSTLCKECNEEMTFSYCPSSILKYITRSIPDSFEFYWSQIFNFIKECSQDPAICKKSEENPNPSFNSYSLLLFHLSLFDWLDYEENCQYCYNHFIQYLELLNHTKPIKSYNTIQFRFMFAYMTDILQLFKKYMAPSRKSLYMNNIFHYMSSIDQLKTSLTLIIKQVQQYNLMSFSTLLSLIYNRETDCYFANPDCVLDPPFIGEKQRWNPNQEINTIPIVSHVKPQSILPPSVENQTILNEQNKESESPFHYDSTLNLYTTPTKESFLSLCNCPDPYQQSHLPHFEEYLEKVLSTIQQIDISSISLSLSLYSRHSSPILLSFHRREEFNVFLSFQFTRLFQFVDPQTYSLFMSKN